MWTSCLREGSDVVTDDEVLGGFQVSCQPTYACEPSWSAPKGAEDAIQYPQKAGVLQLWQIIETGERLKMAKVKQMLYPSKGEADGAIWGTTGWLSHFQSLGKASVKQELLGKYEHTRKKMEIG